jgi:hypothetical protein
MKIYVHILYHLAEFFLEWEMFQPKAVEKIKTHFIFNNFFAKIVRLWGNVEKYGTARQVTDDNIIRRMRFTCWLSNATNTHSECVILIAFPLQQWLRKRAWMLRLYVHCLCFSTATMVTRTRLNITCIRTLPVLFTLRWFPYHFVIYNRKIFRCKYENWNYECFILWRYILIFC